MRKTRIYGLLGLMASVTVAAPGDTGPSGLDNWRKGVIAQLHDTDPQRQSKATSMAKDIGGKDMIRGLAGMLSDTNGLRELKRVIPPNGEMPQSHIVFLPPRFTAAATLSQMIEEPPAELKGKYWQLYMDAEVEIWKKWWEQNKAKYEDEEK